MPFYIYKCENDHYQDEFRSFSDKHLLVECSACELQMKSVPARPPVIHDPSEKTNEIKIKYRYGRPKNIYHFRDAYCYDCDKRILVDCTDSNKEYSNAAAFCEECDGKNIEIDVPIPSIDRFGERFPYYDRGLGMWLQSKSHRKEMCKKLGVEPIEGDLDFSPEVGQIEKKQQEDKQVVADLNDRMKNHPGFAEYRRMKDKGYKPKFKHRKQRS
mgnify:CR=1 FL=1